MKLSECYEQVGAKLPFYAIRGNSLAYDVVEIVYRHPTREYCWVGFRDVSPHVWVWTNEVEDWKILESDKECAPKLFRKDK